MGSKVVQIKPADSPEHVLEEAKGVYEDVLVIGFNKDEQLEVRSSKDITNCEMVWLLEKTKMIYLGVS